MPHWIVSPVIFSNTYRTIRRKSIRSFPADTALYAKEDLGSWDLLTPLSLLLGLAAWALPLMAMSRRLRLGKALAASSLCCSVSLWCQLVYQDHLAALQDWSALLDTSGALVRTAAVLIAVTALLQVGAVVLAGEPRPSGS